MASTKDNVGYVRLEGKVDIWADKEGQIHITSDDSDPLIKNGFHLTINNNERSKLYNRNGYRQSAEILSRYGKAVPGWTPEDHSAS
ncbi:MAG: hypothetical protein ACR2G2_10175 [Pseudonocardia sp.]